MRRGYDHWSSPPVRCRSGRQAHPSPPSSDALHGTLAGTHRRARCPGGIALSRHHEEPQDARFHRVATARQAQQSQNHSWHFAISLRAPLWVERCGSVVPWKTSRYWSPLGRTTQNTELDRPPACHSNTGALNAANAPIPPGHLIWLQQSRRQRDWVLVGARVTA